MDNFDLKKYLAENQLTPNSVMLYRENSILLDEGILQDLGDKIKPALSKIFSTGKSKSKQVYDVVKKEVTDPENAEKVLGVISKAYNGIKNVADKATGDPDGLKAIQKFIPGLKTTAIGTALGAAYQVIAGTSIASSGFWNLSKDIVWGDPSTALNIGIFLVVLKLVMYALQAIANIRKGTSAVKGMFTENEEVMADVDFSDIEDIFELQLN
tara:strand:- start:51 stop:686 length:636 start_codon:yes stop_codon:yes gene_type:complete